METGTDEPFRRSAPQWSPGIFPAILEIGLELLFRIGPFGQRAIVVLLDQCERGRRYKAFLRAGQIKVEPEERVVDAIPICENSGGSSQVIPHGGEPKPVRAVAYGIAR